MIVVSLSDCPPRLRGDITKWLMEINTGVYVGNLSARVRDELWERICQNIGNGRATMVFSSNGEQKLGFYVHNTPWQPVDYDGITLIRRPLPGQMISELPRHFSNAAHRQLQSHSKKNRTDGYCAIDLETTGLSAGRDAIIEIGAVRVVDGAVQEEYQTLVAAEVSVPKSVTELTGITEAQCQAEGIPLTEAIKQLVEFVGESLLVAHNAAFETGFLRYACKASELPMLKNRFADTMIMAKRGRTKAKSYSLHDLADHYGLGYERKHRALDDSRLTAQLYEKLNARDLKLLQKTEE